MDFSLVIRRLVGSLLAMTLLPVMAEAQEQVVVVNFPEVQKVSGTFTVDQPLPQTEIVRLGAEVVAPVGPTETTALVAGGTLDSSGFRSVVLSIAGQVRADRFVGGSVGAILIPDEKTVLRAFDEAGEVLLPLRVEAAADPQNDYFSSSQLPLTLGFPSYRVYFFNTTDQPVSVSLYAYLN